MASMTGDRHAKDQINVRLDPDLIGRLRDGAKRHDQTVTDIVTRGTTAELDRLDGIATTGSGAGAVSPPPKRARKPSADTAPAATFREPESAQDMTAAIFRRKTGEQQ